MVMTISTKPYKDQIQEWPNAGRHILAHFDDETIIVYQAYCPAIAEFALKHGSFGGEFKYTRMSWIKPNFLWMMYRSNWGRSVGQEVVLGIRLRRNFFDSLLAKSVPSSFWHEHYSDQESWKQQVASSDVRLQWDPDHLPNGTKCERRAIQLGLRGETLEQYGREEILELIDLSTFISNQRALINRWKDGELQTPTEIIYPADSLRFK